MDHCFGVQSQQGLDQNPLYMYIYFNIIYIYIYVNLTYVISCQQNIPDKIAPTNLM